VTSISHLDSLRIVLDPVGQTFIAGALFLIMLGVSLGLKTSDFAFLKTDPKIFFTGMVTQLLGLPLLTLALIYGLSPPPSIALGMIVVASCPGGTVSNMLVYFGKGDVAFSISLTATSSLFAAFLTPVSILFWSGLYGPTSALLDTIDYSPIAFILQIAALLALPLFLGLFVSRSFPNWTEKWNSRVANLGATLLLAAVIYGTLQFFPVLVSSLHLLLPVTILHNASAFALGALAAYFVRTSKPRQRTLVFEVGIQNSGLALVILLSQLEGIGGATAIAAIWGIWHLIGGGALVYWFRHRDAKAVK